MNPVTRLEGTPVGALQHRTLCALACLAFVSCPPVFIGVDGAIFNTSNPFDYPDDILQTLSNKQFRKGAHLICMQDRIDYGWEMALLLQREKLKLGGLRFCHKTYVNFPNHPKRDGPGSVFQARMALWMQAKRWGVDMIHFSIAPFHFTHDQGWPNTAFWEALFGFSIDEPCVDDLQLWCGDSINMTLSAGDWSYLMPGRAYNPPPDRSSRRLGLLEHFFWGSSKEEKKEPNMEAGVKNITESETRDNGIDVFNFNSVTNKDAMWMKKDPDIYRDVCKDDECRNKRRAEDDVAKATNEMFGRLRRTETNETRVVNAYSGNSEQIAEFGRREQ